MLILAIQILPKNPEAGAKFVHLAIRAIDYYVTQSDALVTNS